MVFALYSPTLQEPKIHPEVCDLTMVQAEYHKLGAVFRKTLSATSWPSLLPHQPPPRDFSAFELAIQPLPARAGSYGNVHQRVLGNQSDPPFLFPHGSEVLFCSEVRWLPLTLYRLTSLPRTSTHCPSSMHLVLSTRLGYFLSWTFAMLTIYLG